MIDRLAPCVLVLVAGLGSGCVTIYQPMKGLQRPVIVDQTVANFDGTRMHLRCTPTPDDSGADPGESEHLCEQLKTLYSNQGAKVSTEVPEHSSTSEDDVGQWRQPPQKPDLIIELSARRLHAEDSPFSFWWIACIASATLIPAQDHRTFSQEITIRDTDGFLLLSETLQMRFTRYFGLGYFAVNGLLDLIVRPEGEKLTGNNHQKDFSRDFYGQLSQLAFHASMRAKVLRSFSADTSGDVPKEQPAAPVAPPAALNPQQYPPGFPLPPAQPAPAPRPGGLAPPGGPPPPSLPPPPPPSALPRPPL